MQWLSSGGRYERLSQPQTPLPRSHLRRQKSLGPMVELAWNAADRDRATIDPGVPWCAHLPCRPDAGPGGAGMKCSECGHPASEVVETSLLRSGERVRRRRCKGCGALWYTVQPAEVEVDRWRLQWGGGRVIALLPPAKSTENGKI